MTVRRDIDRLDGEGLLERVHGGAVAATPRATDEPGFTAKSTLMTAEKQAIAQEAAHLVQPGATIGISAGTTTYELARAVRDVPQLTVVTNSVPVAQLLHESQAAGHVVVLTGGVRTPSDALVGPVAVTALSGLHVDRLFLGAHGIDRGAGLTTPNLVEAETNRAMVRSARTVCVTRTEATPATMSSTTACAIWPASPDQTLTSHVRVWERKSASVAGSGGYRSSHAAIFDCASASSTASSSDRRARSSPC